MWAFSMQLPCWGVCLQVVMFVIMLTCEAWPFMQGLLALSACRCSCRMCCAVSCCTTLELIHLCTVGCCITLGFASHLCLVCIVSHTACNVRSTFFTHVCSSQAFWNVSCSCLFALESVLLLRVGCMQGTAHWLLGSDCQTGSPVLHQPHSLCWPYVAVNSVSCSHADTAITSHTIAKNHKNQKL